MLRVTEWFFQLYEDDARIGHQEFDLKLTSRVKMSMVVFFTFLAAGTSQLMTPLGWCSRNVVQFLGCVSAPPV